MKFMSGRTALKSLTLAEKEKLLPKLTKQVGDLRYVCYFIIALRYPALHGW